MGRVLDGLAVVSLIVGVLTVVLAVLCRLFRI